jgi:CO/xanthine dehydrogenase Mo-binding subunit
MVSGFGLAYDPSAITGFSDIPYAAPNFSAHYVESNFGIPVGWWRSVGHSQNSFFVESFIDELAHTAGEDPLAVRSAHLKGNARALAVLERVAEMANWGHASVPGATHGVAFVLYSNALLAQIAEVSVESGGEVKVHKVYCAIDCGDVVNPDIVRAQIEGSVIFGLTATLYGEITIEKGRVKQSNFHDHPLLTIKDSPVVETEIIISGATLGGVGETGLPTIAPAVTNAIFAATGHRIRKLPVSRYEFS